MPRLRFKKIRRRLIPNSKGFSSIIGAVFAALVMISLVSTVFVWSLSQNTLYNDAVRQSNLADLDRSNERIFSNLTCYGDGFGSAGTVLVNGTLENYGPLSVQLATLWVIDATNKAYNHVELNIILAPGNITTLSGATAINVPLANSAGDSLSSWFITGRGNTIAEKSFSINYYDTTGVPWNAMTAQGIGSLAFDFDSLTWFYQKGNKLDPYPGTLAYKVPAASNLAFGFNITNYNIDGYDITLDGGTVTKGGQTYPGPTIMWSYFAGVPGHALGPVWSLVCNEDENILPTYTPITLAINQTRFLIFAMQSVGFDNTQSPAVGAINLVFYGNFTKNTEFKGTYGQNVPFVTLYFY